jgi:hypothetical protein
MTCSVSLIHEAIVLLTAERVPYFMSIDRLFR